MKRKSKVYNNDYNINLVPLLLSSEHTSSGDILSQAQNVMLPLLTMKGIKLHQWIMENFHIDATKASTMCKELIKRRIISQITNKIYSKVANQLAAEKIVNLKSSGGTEIQFTKDANSIIEVQDNSMDFKPESLYTISFEYISKTRINLFQESDTLFGKNFVALDKESQEIVLLKVIPKSNAEEISTLIALLLKISRIDLHANLIHPKKIVHDEENVYVYLLTIKTNYSSPTTEARNLFNFLLSTKSYNEKHVINIIQQIANGVKIIHNLKIVSNNINLENIYVTKSQQLPKFLKSQSMLMNNIPEIAPRQRSLTKTDATRYKTLRAKMDKSVSNPDGNSLPKLNQRKPLTKEESFNIKLLSLDEEKYKISLLLTEVLRVKSMKEIQRNIYTAPELLDPYSTSADTTASDIWSIGICSYLILQNYRVPIISSSIQSLTKLYAQFSHDNTMPGRPRVSKTLQSFLTEKVLNVSPSERATIDSLVELPVLLGETSNAELCLFNSNYSTLMYENLRLFDLKEDKKEIKLERPKKKNEGTNKTTYVMAIASQYLSSCSTFFSCILKQSKNWTSRLEIDRLEYQNFALKVFPFSSQDIEFASNFLDNFHYFTIILDFNHVSMRTSGNFGLEDFLKLFLRMYNHKSIQLAAKPLNYMIEKDGTLTPQTSPIPIIVALINFDVFSEFISSNKNNDYVNQLFQGSYDIPDLRKWLLELLQTTIGINDSTTNLKLFAVNDDPFNLFETTFNSIEPTKQESSSNMLPSKILQNIRKGKEKYRSQKFSSDTVIKYIQSKPQHLNLSNQGITPKILEEILPSIISNRSIKTINLSGNGFGDGGLTMLFSSLSQRNKLLGISLSDCFLTTDSAKTIAQYITSNQKLTSIDLSYNNIGDTGAIIIGEALQINTTLLLANLSNCQYSDAGGLSLAQSLRYHPKLEIINIAGNPISYKILDTFPFYIRSNPQRKIKYFHSNDLFSEYLNIRPHFRKTKRVINRSKDDSIPSCTKIISQLIDTNLSNTITELILSNYSISKLKFPVIEKDYLHDIKIKERLKFSRCELLSADLNQITRIPNLSNFPTLKILILSSNRISSLGTSLKNLSGTLEELYLAHNLISDTTDLETSIKGLKKLRILDLRSNKLTVSPNIDDFEELTELLLDNNKLIQSPILKRHESTIQHNKIRRISLTGNIKLHNSIFDIYRSFSRDLQILNLSKCELTEISRNIGLCVCLNELNLSDNQITILPPQISQLIHLQILNISNNRLKSYHSVHSITPLNIKICLIEGNPLPPPLLSAPSFVKMKETIVANIPKNTLLNQMKLAIVGPANSGKSTIARLLPLSTNIKALKKKMQQPIEEIENDFMSIKISEWKSKLAQPISTNYHGDSIRFSIYDYKGSEIYYQLHSLFLKQRSVFLVCLNISIPESKQRSSMIQWLDMLTNSFPNTPVILIGTHTDVITANFTKSADFPNAQAKIDHISTQIVEYYGKKYSNITNFFAINYQDHLSFEQLGKTIIEISRNQPYLKKVYPYQYITLEKLLKVERKIENPPFIRMDQFEQMVLSCGIEGAIQTIAELATLLGLLFHSNGLATVWLDVSWLIQLLSSFNMNQNIIPKGYLYHSNIPKILTLLPANFYPQFFQITNILEILYTSPVPDESKGKFSVIPSLLDAQKPPMVEAKWISVDEYIQLSQGIQLERIYQFNSTPQFGFFFRLIVRLMHFTSPIVLWKSGILCERGDCTSLVEYELGKEISVKVRGKDPSKLLRLIVENIDLLLSGWYQNQPNILVPFTYQMEYQKSTEKQSIFSLEELEVAASKGELEISLTSGNNIKIESIAPDLVLADMADMLIDFKNLKIIKIIGEGGFGKVYTAEYKNQIVAVKQVIVEEHLKVEVYREFRREVALCCELKQPNIVQLIGVCLDPWCIVLELLPYGDLYGFLANMENKICWKMRLTMARNIAEAIRFLHSFQPKIIHRDLKTPNCLMANTDPSADIIVKVTDFGESRAVATSYSGRDRLQNPIWLAPEIMKKDQYTEKADVFSFGIMLWELLVRQKPFDEYDIAKSGFISQLEDAIIGGLRPTIPVDCPIRYRELICDCWHGDPKARPNFEEICERIYALQSTNSMLKSKGKRFF